MSVGEGEQEFRRREDDQDACLIVLAAFSGLRMGELLALRGRHVIWEAQRLHVQRAYTLGEEDSPKGRRGRTIPLAEQPAQAPAKLSQRPMFTRNSDLVFCSRTGEHLDGSALRRRFKAAPDAAIAENPDTPALRYHDLRHTFGTLAAQGFDLVNVQAKMGHADSRTTARYLHARPGRGGRGQAATDLRGGSARRRSRRHIGAGVTPDYSRLLDAALGASIRVEFGTVCRAVCRRASVKGDAPYLTSPGSCRWTIRSSALMVNVITSRERIVARARVSRERPCMTIAIVRAGLVGMALIPEGEKCTRRMAALSRPATALWASSPPWTRRGSFVVRRMQSRGSATTTRSASWPIRMTPGDAAPARA